MSWIQSIRNIPAHWRYPGIILILLTGSCGAQGLLLNAALSGNGPQIEKDYYQRSLNVEKDAAIKSAAKRASEHVQWIPMPNGVVRLMLLDPLNKGQRPVKRAQVMLKRPHLAEFEHSVQATPVNASSTIMEFKLPSGHRGLWDVTLDAHLKDGQRVQAQTRQQW